MANLPKRIRSQPAKMTDKEMFILLISVAVTGDFQSTRFLVSLASNDHDDPVWLGSYNGGLWKKSVGKSPLPEETPLRRSHPTFAQNLVGFC
jgi:hypothetical protein